MMTFNSRPSYRHHGKRDCANAIVAAVWALESLATAENMLESLATAENMWIGLLINPKLH
jgi:hypothetical protein